MFALILNKLQLRWLKYSNVRYTTVLPNGKLVAVSTIVAFAQTSNQAIRFVELPYSEGVLYVSMTAGDSTLVRKAIEIDDTEVVIPVDFSTLMGSKISIQAFQDLNENRNLDKDSYGRPSEPCLQTVIIPNDSTNAYELKLMTF